MNSLLLIIAGDRRPVRHPDPLHRVAPRQALQGEHAGRRGGTRNVLQNMGRRITRLDWTLRTKYRVIRSGCYPGFVDIIKKIAFKYVILIQGDHLACSKPPVDIDLKVALWYKDFILKCNFQTNVNGMF